jgi:hypothetical protein
MPRYIASVVLKLHKPQTYYLLSATEKILPHKKRPIANY